METTLSAMTMERATWMALTDLENEVAAIWTRSMGSIARKEQPSKRGSPDFINPFNLGVHPGEATGNTYVGLEIDRHWQG